jgi:hypothetical protein
MTDTLVYTRAAVVALPRSKLLFEPVTPLGPLELDTNNVVGKGVGYLTIAESRR